MSRNVSRDPPVPVSLAMGTLRTALVVALTLLAPTSLPAAVYEIHEGQSIQLGLDAAAPGDTVLVHPGLYFGEANMDMTFREKPLVLRSVAGPAQTVVGSTMPQNVRVLSATCEPGETIVIDGFTFAYGGAHEGGGLYLSGGGTAVVSNCCLFGCRGTVSDDLSGYGGAVYSNMASTTITNCTFAGNRLSDGWARPPCGGAIGYRGGVVTIERCAFWDTGGDDAVGSLFGGTATAVNCVFDSEAPDPSGCDVVDCLVRGPNLCDPSVLGGQELCSDSVCLPGQNPWRVHVGALDIGCGPCNTVVEPRSWGAIKAFYR